MRLIIPAAAAAAFALALAACATDPAQQQSRYADEYARLSAQCAADGGVLVPFGSPSASGGNPAAEYACERRGGGALVN